MTCRKRSGNNMDHTTCMIIMGAEATAIAGLAAFIKVVLGWYRKEAAARNREKDRLIRLLEE